MHALAALAACPNGIASGCCGAYCSTSCGSGSCLMQRPGCSNTCYKCAVSTCQTTCPTNYFAQPDTSNVCYGLNSSCKKCTPCSMAPGVPSPCKAKPSTCRPGTKAVVIWTGPTGCAQCWACQ